MSALSDLLNRHFELKYGDLSNRRIAERAGISRGTIDNYRKGTHPARPGEEVLSAFHELLGIPLSRLREAAGLPTGEEEPYSPPREANLLDHRQRRAIDDLIRSIVATREARDEDQGTQDTQSDPPADGEAGTDGAPMNDELGTQADYDLAANRTVPGPSMGERLHREVETAGEESQDHDHDDPA